MTFRSMVFLSILWIAPFVLLDFSTKYLAYDQFSRDAQPVEFTTYVTAVKPVRNYGTWWASTFHENEKAEIVHYLQLFVLLPFCFWVFFLLIEDSLQIRFGFAMATGGGAGNILEVAVFGGATDFLSIENTGTFFDNYICNVADGFILLGLLIGFGSQVSCFLISYAWKLGARGFQFLWGGLLHTNHGPNYTPKMAAEIIKRYKRGEPLDDIAVSLGKSIASIRGKLVSEGAYQKYKHLRMQSLLRPSRSLSDPIELRKGEEFPIHTLITKLDEAGYLRASTLREPGQYKVTGGIVDIYGFETRTPVRIDYFGDTIERILALDIRSDVQSVNLTPFNLQLAEINRSKTVM